MKIRRVNKKAVGFEEFLRMILWIIFFIIALLGVYFLIKKVGI